MIRGKMIMRKIYNYVVAAASLLMVLAGCSRENLPSSEPFRVRVGVPAGLESSVSKATFIDGEGMSWADTDLSKFIMVEGTTINDGKVSAATAVNFDGDGVATFEFAQAPAEGTTVSFFYMPGGKTNAMEYTFEAAQKQDRPGRLNPENLLLKAVDVETSESSAAPQMQLVGSVQRFLVYSPTGKYASEKIEAIKLFANANCTVAGLIGYNKLGQPRKNQAMDNTPAETETVFYIPSSAVTVTVANPVEIAATSREETLGKGVYLYVPAGELSAGYRCVILTEDYEYTLNSSSVKTFTNGAVSNFFVNLENPNIIRQERGLPEVKYLGGLPETFTLEAAGNTAQGVSYWYATVDGATKENDSQENYIFYSEENVKFSCTDENNEPVDWVGCKYGEKSTWWQITYEANNTGAERRAVVTATYNIPGYIAIPSVKKVTLVQPSL